MDFSLSPQQKDLVNLTLKVLKDQSEKTNDLHNLDTAFSSSLWKELANTGILGVNIDNDYGGSQLTFLETCLIAESLGSFAVTTPFLYTTILADAINTFSSKELKLKILPKVVKGQSILSAGIKEFSDDFSSIPKLDFQNKELALNGTTNYVAFAKESDFILVSCKYNNKIKLILVNSKSPGIRFTKLVTTTGEYQYRVDFLNTKINQDLFFSELSSSDDKILNWIINRMIIGICSFALGINETSLKLTTSYTSQRNAFKKPIASFQAVRHRTADCYIDIACLRVVTEQAISSLILNKQAEKEVAIAKIWCGDICHRISYACQHLHGGIGIDKDYSLYKYNLWAKQLELSFGSSKFHLRKLGKLIAKN